MRPTYRRPAGTETMPLNMHISPEAKRRLESVAAAAGAPQWAVIEAALFAGRLDAHGIPEGWDLPHPTSDALPIEERKTA